MLVWILILYVAATVDVAVAAAAADVGASVARDVDICLLYTSPSPRDS